MSEEECKTQYMKVLEILKELSILLRQIKSKIIFTEALADILYLYCHTYTYFTPTEAYTRFEGEEVCVRKCEVTCDPRNKEGKHNPFQSEEEKVVFKGHKEYDPTYIWGQLAGWYKQSVDKPNASLSSDRRGTLSYPDLESFDLRRAQKRGKRPRPVKKNKDYTYDIDNLSDGESNKGRLSKKRGQGRKAPTSVNLPSVNEEEYKDEGANKSMTPNPYIGEEDLPQVPIIDGQEDEDSGMEDLCYYPHRKHTKREEFMKVWKHSFSKQWDVI